MTRPPAKKSTAIQSAAPAAAESEETPAVPTPPPRLSLGWRIALVVWLLAFGGLLGMELFGLMWRWGR